MKTKTLLAALLMGMTVVACGQSSKSGDGFSAPKGQVDSVSYYLGISFGSTIKGYDFGDLNYTEILKGMKDFVDADQTLAQDEFAKQFKIDPNDMNNCITAYLQAKREYVQVKAKEESEKFLAENKAKDGIKETASGLQYKIIASGSDKVPTASDKVRVNYKGTLIDGTVFDESPEGEPVELSLSSVIPGWTEGLQLVGEGGKIELYIPSDLAYGESGAGQLIAPNSALIFDVEIVEVIKEVSE